MTPSPAPASPSGSPSPSPSLAVTLSAEAQPPSPSPRRSLSGPGPQEGQGEGRPGLERGHPPAGRAGGQEQDRRRQQVPPSARRRTDHPQALGRHHRRPPGAARRPGRQVRRDRRQGEQGPVKQEVNRIIGTFNDDGRQFYQRHRRADGRPEVQAGGRRERHAPHGRGVQPVPAHQGRGGRHRAGSATWHLDRGRYAQAANAFRTVPAAQPEGRAAGRRCCSRPPSPSSGRQATDPSFGKEAQKYWEQFEKASEQGAGDDRQAGGLIYEQAEGRVRQGRGGRPAAVHVTSGGRVPRQPVNTGIGQGGTPFLEARFTYPYQMPDGRFQLRPGRRPGSRCSRTGRTRPSS